MPTVFLSYRRSDTSGEAGRLADTSRTKFGPRLVFRDVTNIPLGLQFDSVLQEEMATAKTVLVLIGPTSDRAPIAMPSAEYRLPENWRLRLH